MKKEVQGEETLRGRYQVPITRYLDRLQFHYRISYSWLTQSCWQQPKRKKKILEVSLATELKLSWTKKAANGTIHCCLNACPSPHPFESCLDGVEPYLSDPIHICFPKFSSRSSRGMYSTFYFSPSSPSPFPFPFPPLLPFVFFYLALLVRGGADGCGCGRGCGCGCGYHDKKSPNKLTHYICTFVDPHYRLRSTSDHLRCMIMHGR